MRSPDGAPQAGLFTARPDGTDEQRVPFPAMYPTMVTWSQDGAWLYYVPFNEYSISRVRRSDGRIERIAGFSYDGMTRPCPTITGEGLSVNAAGEVAFTCASSGVYVVGASGTRLVYGSATWNGLQIRTPVWSPDGTRLAFVEAGATPPVIRVLNAATGQVTATVGAPEAHWDFWSSYDICWTVDKLVFTWFGNEDALYAVNASGGTPVRAAKWSFGAVTCTR
jgi:Tol biopolymer transport system component